LVRTSRELFLSVLTGDADNLETWVIDRMASVVDEEDVEAGKRLFARGEQPEHIFFVRDGRIRLERDASSAWIFEGRSVIGVFDALLDRPHSRTAVADSNLHLLKLRVEHWLDLLEDSFGLARAALGNAVSTVAALEARQWASEHEPRGPIVFHPPSVEPPLTFVERIAILSEISLLRGAGVQVLVELADSLEELTFQPGVPLFQRGESHLRVHLVLRGEVLAERTNPDLSVRFGPGSFVGGVASLGNTIGAWEARAETATHVLSFRIEDWLDLMEEHFDLVRSALSALALLREGILDDFAARDGDVRVG
jgi:CRP-like cAMP-binding protein